MEGYNKRIDDFVPVEFSHLNGVTYLDHTGTTLYAASQLRHYHEDLLGNLYGNPHSHNSASSQLTTDTIEQVRYSILQHFNTTPDQHSVIFTSGCTGALKLLCEAFDWSGCHTDDDGSRTANANLTTSNNASPSTHNALADTHNASLATGNTSRTTHNAIAGIQTCVTQETTLPRRGAFCYLNDNHTSVIGMRECAREKGAQIVAISFEEIDRIFQDSENETSSQQQTSSLPKPNALFAYPAQSNFSGQKYPLKWCTKVKKGHLATSSSPLHYHHGNWHVVLDAAAMAATSPLDLGACTADFITVSFYKMFGFPTGLGALIVKKGSEHVLRKKSYFGGGTVLAYLSEEQFHVPKPSTADRFEDGTISFLDIIAVKHGLDAIARIAGDMDTIQRHTFTLANYVYDKMATLHHGNGSLVARIYCHGDYEDVDRQGPIINFNLLRPNGDYVGYAEVDSLASLHDIHLRTGCFCNTGACQQFLGLSSQQIKDNFRAGHVCGDDIDIINGQPTGSVRISFGYMSTKEDADHFLKFISECFVKKDTILQQADATVVQMKSIETKLCIQRDGEENFKDCAKVVCALSGIKSGISKLPLCKVDNTIISTSRIVSPSSTLTLTSDIEGLQHGTVTNGNTSIAHGVESARQSESKILLTNTVAGINGNPSIACGVESARQAGNKMVLTNIFLYPVKSCGAMEVLEWDLGPRGLLYDRHWMIVNSSGVCLSQKREHKMCLIKPHIDLHTGILQMSFPGLQTLSVPLEGSHQVPSDQVIVSKNCQSKVCGERVEMIDCGDLAADWLQSALGKTCRLLKQNLNFQRECKFNKVLSSDQKQQVSLAQESPYLLMNRVSCKVLMGEIQKQNGALATTNGNQSTKKMFSLGAKQEATEAVELENLLGRFRGNFVMDNVPSFQEDGWKKVQIGHQVFMVGGLCTRCQMICVNQDTAERSKEPLLTLTHFRGKRVPFGVHLLRDQSLSSSTKICVNDLVTVLEVKT